MSMFATFTALGCHTSYMDWHLRTGIIGTTSFLWFLGRTWKEIVVNFCFFQAEDGIRDLTVTGVQTCALPICLARFSCLAAALLVLWPWVATVSLALASIALPAASLERAWAVPLYTSLGIPLGILGLLCFLVRDLFESQEKFS